MKKILVFSSLLMLSSIFLLPQDYRGRARISGTVMDESGNPLEGVNVKLVHTSLNQGFDVVTDSDGMWVASWIKGGSWNIDFEKPGYAPKKITIKVKEGAPNPDIEVKLEKIEGLSLISALKDRLNEANALYEQKKFDDAIIAYKEIVEQFPDVYIINVSIGNCYFEKGDYDQAILYYQKALEGDPDNSQVKMYIGNSYSNKGDSEKAQEWYNKIDFQKIQDVNVLYNLGTDFYSVSKFSEALKYYKRAVELKGNFLDAIYQLGLTYLSLGNNQEALVTFESYLEQDSDSQRGEQVKGFVEYLRK
jgi:predicted Zn-dependent protease